MAAISDDSISIYEVSRDYSNFQDAAIAATYFVLNGGEVLEPRGKKLEELKAIIVKAKPSEADKRKLLSITANDAQTGAMLQYRSTNQQNHPKKVVGLGVWKDEKQDEVADFMRLDFEPTSRDPKQEPKGIHFNATPLDKQGRLINPKNKFAANIAKGNKSIENLQTEYNGYINNLQPASSPNGIAALAIWGAWSRGRVAN